MKFYTVLTVTVALLAFAGTGQTAQFFSAPAQGVGTPVQDMGVFSTPQVKIAEPSLVRGGPLAGRSRGTDVPVRIFSLFPVSTLAEFVIPE